VLRSYQESNLLTFLHVVITVLLCQAIPPRLCQGVPSLHSRVCSFTSFARGPQVWVIYLPSGRSAHEIIKLYPSSSTVFTDGREHNLTVDLIGAY
jgi:hypothetical protein